MPGYIAPTVRKQRVVSAGAQLPFAFEFGWSPAHAMGCSIQSGSAHERGLTLDQPSAHASGLQCSGWVFLPQLNQCRKSLTDMSRDCFPLWGNLIKFAIQIKHYSLSTESVAGMPPLGQKAIPVNLNQFTKSTAPTYKRIRVHLL